MNNVFKVLLIIILLLPEISCRQLKHYFREPETEVLVETLHSTVLAGFAANVAMAVMEGRSFPNVTVLRSNAGYPCTTLMVVDLTTETNLSFAPEKASAVTIAGLWPDASTAILTLLYTDYHIGSTTLDLIGIETIPVIRDGDNIRVAMASMDVSLIPDQESILQLNLSNLEIESELFRLDMLPPEDVYIAVVQNAYYIEVDNVGTSENIGDDTYTITGGGQLIEVAGNSAEIVQQAMVEVQVSSGCSANPLGGMALVKVTGLEDEGFPELGTAVLQFPSECNGTANVYIATGMYAVSNGKNISFLL